MRLEYDEDLDDAFSSNSLVDGSGLPHRLEAHEEEFDVNDVEERSEIESDRFLRGEIWTCFSICKEMKQIMKLSRQSFDYLNIHEIG